MDPCTHGTGWDVIYDFTGWYHLLDTMDPFTHGTGQEVMYDLIHKYYLVDPISACTYIWYWLPLSYLCDQLVLLHFNYL